MTLNNWFWINFCKTLTSLFDEAHIYGIEKAKMEDAGSA